jgi:hypothetical protein
MQEGSYQKGHIKSNRHENAVAACQELEIRHAQSLKQYNALYRAPPVRLCEGSFAISCPLPGLGTYSGLDVNGLSGSDFQLSSHEAETFFPHLETLESINQQLLQDELERLQFLALEDGFEEDHDNTVPALMQQFQTFGKS